MLNVHEALQIIIRNAKICSLVNCPIDQACGKILREDIKTDRPYPPFNKSLMDGIAIRSVEWMNGQRQFKIATVIPAGVVYQKKIPGFSAVQIMTGAVVPKGFDCVIPIEEVAINEGLATVNVKSILKNQFIRFKGQDAGRGEKVLNKGVWLNPSHLGLIASVGRKRINVSKRINAVMVSTGDELVDVGRPITVSQARFSNAYVVKAALESTGLAHVDLKHVKDHPGVLKKHIGKAIMDHDMVILSGGVSKGLFDHVPGVLKALKVREIFHGVLQKPGKPFWFGMTKDQKPVFALPGNPASTAVCIYRYVIPWLFQACGGEYQQHVLAIGTTVNAKETVQFIPVSGGKILPHGGSGDLAGWGQSDGFIEYDSKEPGPLRPYFSWRI